MLSNDTLKRGANYTLIVGGTLQCLIVDVHFCLYYYFVMTAVNFDLFHCFIGPNTTFLFISLFYLKSIYADHFLDDLRQNSNTFDFFSIVISRSCIFDFVLKISNKLMLTSLKGNLTMNPSITISIILSNEKIPRFF